MTPAEQKQALELAARWREIRTDESHGPQGKNLGILARAVDELDTLLSEANQDKEAMSARISNLERAMRPEALKEALAAGRSQIIEEVAKWLETHGVYSTAGMYYAKQLREQSIPQLVHDQGDKNVG